MKKENHRKTKLYLRVVYENKSNMTNNVHPREIQLEEFLGPMDISAFRLSKETGTSQTRASPIIKGKRKIIPDTALRFSKYFGTSAKFWLGLQDDFDVEKE